MSSNTTTTKSGSRVMDDTVVRNSSGQDVNSNLIIKTDTPDSNTTYIGRASLGTLASQAFWQIKKILVDGTAKSVLFADGDDGFNNVWDNRASLSYS